MVLLIITAVFASVKSIRMKISRIARHEVKKIEKVGRRLNSKVRAKSTKQLESKGQLKIKTQKRSENKLISDGVKEEVKNKINKGLIGGLASGGVSVGLLLGPGGAIVGGLLGTVVGLWLELDRRNA
jgi:hypothetical protein